MPLRDVPLHLALAWVLTRSDDFLFYVEREGSADVDALWMRFNEGKPTQLPKFAEGCPDAWEKLKSLFLKNANRDSDEHMVSDIWGAAFEKGDHIDRIGVFGQPFDKEIDVGRFGWIPSDQLSKLVLDLGQSEYRLRPSDWARNGGWWWREVEVELTAIVSAFGQPEQSKGPRRKRRPSPQNYAIAQALAAIRDVDPDRWKTLLVGQQCDKIGDWIKKNTELKSIDQKTIRRYFAENSD